MLPTAPQLENCLQDNELLLKPIGETAEIIIRAGKTAALSHFEITVTEIDALLS